MFVVDFVALLFPVAEVDVVCFFLSVPGILDHLLDVTHLVLFLLPECLVVHLAILLFMDGSLLLPQLLHLFLEWVHLVFKFHTLFFELHLCELYPLLNLVLG